MNNNESLTQQLISVSYLIQKEAKKLDELCNLEILNLSEIERTIRHLDNHKETINFYFKSLKHILNEEK